jgi:hypothetical protein
MAGTGNIEGIAPRARKNIRQRNKLAHGVQQRKGTHTSTIPGFNLSALKFQSIPALTVKERRGESALSEGGMLQQLLKAYRRYCKLSDIKPQRLDASLNTALQVKQLYGFMHEIVSAQDNRLHLNIDSNGDRYWFTAYRYIGADNYTIYAFPTRILAIADKKHPQLFKALTPFMAWVYAIANFNDWKKNGYFEYMTDYFVERMDDDISEMLDASKEYKKEYQARIKYTEKTIEPYAKEGIGEWYLNMVRNPSIPFEALQEALNDYRPGKKLHKEILGWMKAGLDLLNSPNAVSLMNLGYDEEGNNEHDEPVGLENIFLFVWDEDDVLEEYMNNIGNDSNEFGCMSPVQWHIINSKTESVYQANEWPIQFINWFDGGIGLINEYINKYGKK